jgi:hypothetical protein
VDWSFLLDAMRLSAGAARHRDDRDDVCGTLLTMIDHVTGAVMGDRQLYDEPIASGWLARAVL